jgi:8-oxo-dGTP pyrophosphatase MutT (NUDIX family)
VFPGGRIDPEDYPAGEVSTDADAVLTAARNAAAREAMEEAGLVVDPDALTWFAHWTPGVIGATRRFATWFFVGVAPEGQVVIDDGEIRDHQWIRPADAIARRDAGEVELVAPTWVTLHRLCAFADVEAALAALGRSEPEYFASRVGDFEGRHFIVWAGDAGYDDLELGRPGARHRLHVLDSGWVYERHD